MLKEYVNVALFARAWIEIALHSDELQGALVALFARAWIEITKVITPGLMSIVALFARAWIEIKFDGFS